MQRRTWYGSALAPFTKAHTSLSALSLSPEHPRHAHKQDEPAEVQKSTRRRKKIVLVAQRLLLFLSFGNANISPQLTTFLMRLQLLMS